MNELERRYHRLLRAYPSEYRRARGAEIVGTYLDLARPGQRRPSLADTADLVLGGLRQRLRAAGASDLAPGVRLAAVLAFITASALAAGWSVAETHHLSADLGFRSLGPVNSAGAVAWGAWLVAAVMALVAPGRVARTAVVVALVLTVAVIPVRALVGLPRPPLLVLVPQIALGLVALALPDRLGRSSRIALPAAMGTAALLAVGRLKDPGWWAYHGPITELRPVAGAALLAAAVLIAAGLAARRDMRGVWAILVLLTPVGLLCVGELAAGMHLYTYSSLIGVALAVTMLGPATLAVAMATRRWAGWQANQALHRSRR
ncbi:hypothetical protein [Micromonospora sp. NPDC003776]